MMLSDFPDCCGATIVHRLDNGISPLNLKSFSDNAIGIAITSSEQKKAIKQLKKLGWRPVRKFRNKRLTVWISSVKLRRKKKV